MNDSKSPKYVSAAFLLEGKPGKHDRKYFSYNFATHREILKWLLTGVIAFLRRFLISSKENVRLNVSLINIKNSL